MNGKLNKCKTASACYKGESIYKYTMMNRTNNGTPHQVFYWLQPPILQKNWDRPFSISLKSVFFSFSFLFFSVAIHAQCEAEVSGIFTYCNSFDNGQLVSSYFVGFRVSIPAGDTLNVIDLNGNVPDNQGKRIDDINTQQEPLNISVQQLMISGVGADTLEFWYFGPYANNDTFNIALVDPDEGCDTLFVASGTYTCEDHSGTSDPGACDNDVPLYFFDFSQTEFTYGGGGGGNENNDAFFLVMQRSRENFCCDLQPSNQRCFEFILRLGQDDIGLSIDDVGNGTPGGELYADTLNLFTCTGNSDMTWPLTQGGGQSQDAPLCLTGELSRDFIVLSCKSGSNVTGVSIDALSEINVPPVATWDNCSVALNVLHADTAIWTSDDDPNLDNLVSCTGDSLYCEFYYNSMVFGEITACEGDTFTYFVSGTPSNNECFPSDTVLYDTTYVIVYPAFYVEIDSICYAEGDSVILTATVTSTGIGCNYYFIWSTGDTTQSITVPLVDSVYSIMVNRPDIPLSQQNCPIGSDMITISTTPVFDCENLEDRLYSCIAELPLPDFNDVMIGGCSISPLLFLEDETNNGSGCWLDTLIISRYYIVDFDGDTINTTSDQATCIQRLMYVDDQAPNAVGNCPYDTAVDCSTVDLSFLLPSDYTDNCTEEEEIIITFRDDTLSGFDGSCINYTTGIVQRIWFAADTCGNIDSNCIQSIYFIDTIPPVINFCPADIIIIFPASTLPSNTGSASALDSCDPTPVVSYTDSIPPGPCPELNYVIRTWIAIDACGNSNECQQQIIIDDHGSICGTVSDNLGQVIGGMEMQLMLDLNSNQILDMGDTLIAIVYSDTLTGSYCFEDIWPCDFIIMESQPIDYFDIYDYDLTPDPDGNDSLDGPDNEIPVSLAQGESDLQNNFVNVVCPIVLPLIPPDTICEGGSVVLEIEDLNLGALEYTWDFGSGSDPSAGNGLGPHTISYITTSENQAGGAIIALTISKEDCPDLTGQVSTVEINPYPDPSINGSTSTGCYFSERVYQPLQPEIPGATYQWSFGAGAIPATAVGYGPHTVYYTSAGSKAIKLVIYPNEAGPQCPDSSNIVFNIISCPSQILGRVVTDINEPLPGVNIRLYADADMNGEADNGSAIRSVYTTSTGFYSMTSLTPGHYVLVQTQPAGWFTYDDYDASDDGDMVPNTDSHDNLIPTTLIPSEVDSFNVFVETALPGAISGTIFVDIDNDQLPDAGEGLAGVEVKLFVDADTNGEADTLVPLNFQITNSNGEYIMAGVPVGHYVLVEIQPACYLSVKDYDSSNDADEVSNSNMHNDTIPVTIFNGEVDAHNYFIDIHANTLWVENTNDDGAGSLRELLDCSESGDTILFHASLAGLAIEITTTDIEINNDVILYSTLTPRLTIASETIGLFSVHEGAVVEFSGMDIISGLSPENMGAAFLNLGVLKLNLVSVFRNINLQSGQYLIRNESGGEMYISGNCFIEMD